MGITPIAARIALQLTLHEYNKAQCTPLAAGLCARQVLRDLPLELDSILRLALHSLGVYLDLGFTSLEWLQAVLEASHFGHSFRRCFFFEYKANRSPYPRVTNRGVQDSSKPASGRKRRGISDE
jgi:hypothetical protein